MSIIRIIKDARRGLEQARDESRRSREALTEALHTLTESLDRYRQAQPHATPTHVQADGGLQLNTPPEQAESD